MQRVGFAFIEGMIQSLNSQVTLWVFSVSRKYPDTCSMLLMQGVMALLTGVFLL